ncbi:MAG: RNA methyltransferase [Bacteroidota bacterium]
MVVKNQIKFIKSLHQKKYRIQHGMFVVEGIKIIRELLEANYEPYVIYMVHPTDLDVYSNRVYTIKEADLKKISGLRTPNGALAVFYIPKYDIQEDRDWVLVLDDVRDPGNLGTIIRLCDWFGIRRLVCSPQTVDCYNPKVLQATMGSIARVEVVYEDISNFLRTTQVPIYGAFMTGESVYNKELPPRGILIMGNEANGISKDVEALISEKISIPQFGESTTESLNVAMATSILLNEIRRVGA